MCAIYLPTPNHHREKDTLMKLIKGFRKIINGRGLISITWLIFTIIFFSFGYHHWQVSKNNISPFPIPHSNKIEKNVNQALVDFGTIINYHVFGMNKLSTRQNHIAAFGYWAAAATAVFSMCLAWPRKPKYSTKE